MNKTTTLIYHEWAELFDEMPPEDVKTIILALLRYDATGEAQEVYFETKLVKAVYKMMFEKTEKNRSLYLEKCENNRKNGALGGRPKKNENPEKPERKGKEGKGLDGIGKEVSGNNNTPPTLAQVKQFCADEGLAAVDTDRFWNYYETQHWLIDGEPMNWQARIKVWNSQDGDKKKHKKTDFQNYHQREYDFAAIEKQLLAK